MTVAAEVEEVVVVEVMDGWASVEVGEVQACFQPEVVDEVAVVVVQGHRRAMVEVAEACLVAYFPLVAGVVAVEAVVVCLLPSFHRWLES